MSILKNVAIYFLWLSSLASNHDFQFVESLCIQRLPPSPLFTTALSSTLQKQDYPSVFRNPAIDSSILTSKDEKGRLATVQAFAEETNLILQVQTSHLDRLVDYLQYARDKVHVLGLSRSTGRKNISLLFLKCDDPVLATRQLCHNPLLARAIKQSYTVQSGLLLEGSMETEKGCQELTTILFDKIPKLLAENDQNTSNGRTATFRMQLFPPTNQGHLLRTLANAILNNNDRSELPWTISPKEFSHMLSIVQVHQQHDPQKDKEDCKCMYMIGISPASLEMDVVDTNSIFIDSSNGVVVSRAYYKLKEAFETYSARNGTIDRQLSGSVALDCGSAPGGWTKYLIDSLKCSKVYSIDPGALAPSILEIPETNHLKLKVQDAIPMLCSLKEQVKVWVSDMCLFYMEEQIDHLLSAKREGLLAPNTFFVLTLKCIAGHSKASYDSQVQAAVDVLRSSAEVYGLQTFHLFSNRSGERTVMGYIV